MAKLLLQPGTAQLKGFFPSWSPSTWLSKLKRRVNFFSQPSLGHGNILLSPEWTRSSCRRKNQKLLNSLLHRPHSTLSETRGVVSVLQLAWVTWHQCFLEFHLYLCVLFCASDNLTKFFPEKDTLQSHKGSLPQKDRGFTWAHALREIHCSGTNLPSCIFSWCFSFLRVRNSLVHPVKEQLEKK